MQMKSAIMEIVFIELSRKMKILEVKASQSLHIFETRHN